MDIDSLLQPLDPLQPQTAAPLPRQAWHWHLRQGLAAYLSLLVMALLALGTWWLVQHTPRPEVPVEASAPRHEPDYTMQDFTLQRFDAEGRLRVQVQGKQLRHYPDTDTLEIDGVTIRALAADGGVTRAVARRALSNGDASEVQLLGGAQVIHEATSQAKQVEFEGEFLHAFIDTEKLRSHLPVRLRQGGSDLRVGGIEYDHSTRLARLGGPVRARLDLPRR